MQRTDHAAQQGIGCQAGDRRPVTQLADQIFGQGREFFFVRLAFVAAQLFGDRLVPFVDEAIAVGFRHRIDPGLAEIERGQPVLGDGRGSGTD